MNLIGKTESVPLFLATVKNQSVFCFTFEENYLQSHDINVAGWATTIWPSLFFYFDNVTGTIPDT